MTEAQIAELMAWIAGEGLAGRAETDVIGGFCERLAAHGVPLTRVISFIDTLHPIYEGRAFRWERGIAGVTGTDYGRSNQGEAAERWLASPFYQLLASGESLLRRRVTPESEGEYFTLRGLAAASITDYVAIVDRFAADGAIGGMDCFYSSWMTDRESGFTDADLALIRRLTPFVGLAVKSASLGRLAQTLVETYLGRDAGRRVLDGRIERGVTDRIKAVLWFSDLRNFTRITDTAPPEQIIPMLNDYADIVVSAIHDNEGDVLKLIGDGVLASFRRRSAARPAPPRSTPRDRPGAPSRRSMRGAPAKVCPLATSIWGCTSVRSSTATSAARRGSTSPSSGRRSTR